MRHEGKETSGKNTGGHRDASHSAGYPLVSSHSARLSRQSLRYATLLPLVPHGVNE